MYNTKNECGPEVEQALRGVYAIVCLKCWYTSKVTQLCITVSQTSYSTMKPRGGRTSNAPIHKGSNLGTGIRELTGSCHDTQKLIPP